MLFKKKHELTDREIDYAIAKYVEEVHNISAGKIKYVINKSTGRLYGAKVDILKENT